MRLKFLGVAVLLMTAVSLFSQEPKGVPSAPKGVRIGDLVPGPFYPFVTHGNQKNRIRCLINEKAMEKVLLVFVQSTTVADFIPKALADLDTELQKVPDPKKGIGSAVLVFVNPELKSVITDDDKRDAFVKTVLAAIPDGKLQRIVIGVDDAGDLADYQLPKDAKVVVLTVENLKVQGLKILKDDEMTLEKFAGVLAK